MYITVFVHALCERGGVFSCFSNVYKYDRSYKMLSHLKVHSIFFFNYRKCHHDKLLKHITSILGRGLYPLIELDGKRMGVGGVRRMARAQRNRGGKDHENKRQRRRDTVVTEGNGNTK